MSFIVHSTDAKGDVAELDAQVVVGNAKRRRLVGVLGSSIQSGDDWAICQSVIGAKSGRVLGASIRSKDNSEAPVVTGALHWPLIGDPISCWWPGPKVIGSSGPSERYISPFSLQERNTKRVALVLGRHSQLDAYGEPRAVRPIGSVNP